MLTRTYLSSCFRSLVSGALLSPQLRPSDLQLRPRAVLGCGAKPVAAEELWPGESAPWLHIRIAACTSKSTRSWAVLQIGQIRLSRDRAQARDIFGNSPVNSKAQPSLQTAALAQCFAIYSVWGNLLGIVLNYRFQISRSGPGSG